MNETTLNEQSTNAWNAGQPAAVFAASDPSASRAGFETRFSFYHANPKNGGYAMQFWIEPATPDRDGALFFAIARQKTAADASAAGPARFASFDWQNKAVVKLNVIEVSEMLMVLGGQAPSLVHAGKDGLYHTSPSATTSITLKRADDPSRPGFVLGVGRTPKADPNARQYYSFAFRPPEAFTLRAALMAEMGLLAFGLPRERRPAQPAQQGAAGAFAPPPATPAQPFGAPQTAPVPPFGAAAAAPADGGFGEAF